MPRNKALYKDFYSATEVADILDVTPETIKTRLKSGKIQGGKVFGTIWRIPKNEVLRLVREARGR